MKDCIYAVCVIPRFGHNWSIHKLFSSTEKAEKWLKNHNYEPSSDSSWINTNIPGWVPRHELQIDKIQIDED